MLTPEELEKQITEKLRRLHELERRFAALWGESGEACDARRARELAMDGELRDISATARLAVVRQFMLALDEHDLIDHDREDWDIHLRAVSARMGIPLLELRLVSDTALLDPETSRGDLDDWVEWCSANAPQRLKQGAKQVRSKQKAAPRRKAVRR